MGNAVATLDDDYAYEKPSRKKKSAGKARTARKRPIDARFRFDLKKLTKIAAMGAGAVAAVVIMVNALEFQKGHHPAPLFGKAIALRQAAKPTPEPEKVAPAPSAPTASPAPAPAATKPQQHANAASPTKEPGEDQIARLLGGGLPSSSASGKDDGKTVSGVQRALVKLHLLPKVTGTMGSATKKAIAKFEKDQHLPVKGEISRKLVKVLSAESGVKID